MKQFGFGLSLLVMACGGAEWNESTDVEPVALDAEMPPLVRGDLCVATFTRGVTSYDAASDTTLSAQPGDQLLLSQMWSSEAVALLIPAGGGMLVHELSLTAPDWPFETRCRLDRTEGHVAVFAPVTLYADAALREPICELPRGTIFPSDRLRTGAAGEGVNELDVLSWPAPCAGHARAFFALADGASPVQQVLRPRAVEAAP